MFDELHSYLGGITTPENQSVLIDACTLLTKAGVRSHEADVEQILRTSDDHEHFHNLQDLFTALDDYLNRTIAQFGLEVSETVPLNALNQILDSLLILSDFGDPEALLNILHSELNVEDKLCDIFAVVNVLSWGDFAPYIDRVSPSLMDRLENVIEGNCLPEAQSVDLSEHRARYTAWRELFADSLALTIVREGFRLNSPLSSLLGRFNEEIETVAASPTKLAEALVSVLVVSDVPKGDYIKMGEALLEDYAQDINVVTKTHGALIRCLKELEHAQS